MAFKKRRAQHPETTPADRFQHASGYTDLAGVLGEHTLTEDQEAAAKAPKGYRARSVAKPDPRRA
jgi:hypothetical protein